jgi:hypothetical protein
MIRKEDTGPILRYFEGTSMDGMEETRRIPEESVQTEFTVLYSYKTAGAQAASSACNQ